MIARIRLVLLSAALALPVGAATFVVPSDREMVQRADAIVIANAAYSASRLNHDGGIETVTQMFVEEVIKGNPTGSLTVVEPGGAYGSAATAIPGVPRFVPGQRMLLFLRSVGPDRWAVADLVLGKFTFVNDGAGRPLLLRDENEIVGWDPDLKQHVEAHRSAPEFLDFVRREARGASGAVDYVVPEPVATGSSTGDGRFRATTMIAPYTATSYTIIISGSMGARWTVFPSGVNWFTGTTQEPGAPGGGVTAVQTGIASWNNDCPSNVNYVYAGTDNGTHTQGLHAADGENTVLFERDLSSYGITPFTCSANGYSGTLGIGGVTSASGTNTVGGETFMTTIEGDVEMNKGLANCTLLFSNGDFNSAVTHELGHTLGFRHSDQTRSGSAACTTDPSLECSNNAIMKAFIATGLNAALQAWDQHAVEAVYPSQCSSGGGDGKADLVWRNYSSGANTVWQMSGATRIGFFTLPTEPSTQWTAEATGDFNRDGSTDLVWRNYSTGQNTIWLMSGGVYQSTVFLPTEPDPNWHIEGAGDFNGDGNPDIVWHNYQTGASTIWIMSGTSRQSVAFLPTEPDVNWHIVGVGDFNGDGGADLVWRNLSTGANTLWIMSGTSRSQFFFLQQEPDPSWHIVAVGDFDGDGHADIVWRNFSTGANTMWFMNGSTRVGFAALTAESNPSWRIETAGDFR